MTADASQVVSENKRIAKGAAEVTEEYTKLTRENQRLSSVATQAIKSIQTPLEKYLEQTKNLDAALQKDLLTQGEYNRALDVAKNKLAGATDSGMKLSTVFSSLSGYVSGFLSVGAAIKLVGDSIEHSHEQAVKAADDLRGRFVTRGELAQVYGSLEEADQVTGQFRLRGGVRTNQEADRAAFAIQSAGLRDQMETFLQSGETGLVGDITGLINSVASLQAAFLRPESGDAKQLISKALIASSITKVPLQTLSAAVSKAAQPANQLGFGDEETFAALASTINPLSDAGTAEERIRAFLSQVKVSGIGKETLGKTIESIKTRKAGGESLSKIFGGVNNQTAEEGAQALINAFDKFTEITARIQEGNDGKAFENAVRAGLKDPKQMALVLENRGSAMRDSNDELKGRRELLLQNMIDLRELEQEQSGVGAVGRFLSRTVLNSNFIGLRATGQESVMTNDEIAIMMERAIASGNEPLKKTLELLAETQAEYAKVIAEEQRRKAAPTLPRPDRGG